MNKQQIKPFNNKTVGNRGEEIATAYLLSHGYKIIERNIRFSKECEIDIIASNKNTLVAIEVKTRTTEKCGIPTEAVTKKKYMNIKKGLLYYLNQNKGYKKSRIDVIGITLTPELKIEHLKDL